MKTNSLKNILLFLIALVAWSGLIVQFILMLETRTISFATSALHYFSYFTILSNAIVAVCSLILLIGKKSKAYNFFSKSSTLTAITVYIVVVGIIFNLLLRPIMELDFIHEITSDTLHVATPVLFLLFWLMVVEKHSLQWKYFLSWLIYPVVYVIYTFIHGMITGFYPYPFIDINKIGMSKALMNGTMIMIVFVLLSLIFIAIGKIYAKPSDVK